MPRIKTEELKEGMVVITDVKNMDDMLLIPAGAKLTARQIGILQAWGVLEIDVKSDGGLSNTDIVSKLPPETLAKLTAETRGIFWKPDDHDPVFAEILKLLLRRRIKRGQF
jgi:hypothetical protein